MHVSLTRDRDRCQRHENEPLFNIIIRGLFEEGMVPPGDVLDIGANNGDWACFYGCLDLDREVHAMEPNPLLADSISCPTTNVKKYNMAMSSQSGKINFAPQDKKTFVGDLKSKVADDGKVTVTTMDNFFQSRGSFPGFMHLDVEGYEQDLIKGGLKTITEYSPLFSYEVHLNSSLARSTIEEVEKLGYISYMINEVCGVFEGCRNLLAFPSKNMTRYETGNILDFAINSKALVYINSANSDDVFNKYKGAALAWGDSGVFGESTT